MGCRDVYYVDIGQQEESFQGDIFVEPGEIVNTKIYLSWNCFSYYLPAL